VDKAGKNFRYIMVMVVFEIVRAVDRVVCGTRKF
jgi:hypothetical protein